MAKKDTVLRILEGSLKILSNSDRWIQGQYATKRNRMDAVSEDAQNAFCFCAAGALRRSTHKVNAGGALTGYHEATLTILNEARKQSRKKWQTIPDWNDNKGRTYAQVLSVFEKAVAARKNYLATSAS